MDQTPQSPGPRYVLEGGPAGITPGAVPDGRDRLKIPHQGGYEHFERLDGAASDTGADTAVYRWVARTKVAE